MPVAGSLQLSHDLGLCRNQGCNKQYKDILGRSKLPLLSTKISLCFIGPSQAFQPPCTKVVSVALTRSYNVIQSSPIILKLASTIGVIMFGVILTSHLLSCSLLDHFAQHPHSKS